MLTSHDKPFKKTHDLDELSRVCLEVDATLQDIVLPAIPLTVFAWEFRYPGDTLVPSMTEARDSVSIAESLYRAVLQRLPQPCHP